MTARQTTYKAPNQGRVLMAEDDELTGKALQKDLQKRNFEVDLFNNFAEAEKAMKVNDYHALVADVFLSKDKADGLELVSLAKAIGIPAVIMTSALDMDVAKRGLNNGADHLIEKPFQGEELAKILLDIWENPRGLIARRERCFAQNQLTEKERELSRLILKGLTNQEISEIVGTTVGTVKFYSSQIFEKLSVKNRAEFFNLVFPT